MRRPKRKWVTVLALLVMSLDVVVALAAQQPMYFRHLTLQDGLSQNTIMTILQDSQGFVWLGSENGLNRYDGYEIVHYQRDRDDPSALQGDFIWQIAEDQNSDLWIATNDGGVARWERKTDRFYTYQHDPDDPNSLASNSVRSLIVGAEGFIWIGLTDHGLNVLNPETGEVQRFAHDPYDEHSLSSNAVYAVHQDRAGSVWIGTDAGLNLYNPSNRGFLHYHHDPADSYSLSSNLIRSVYEDKQGMLWVGTYGGGLNRLNRLSNQFTRYVADDANPQSLSDNHVRVTFEDDTGRLWVGTANGLNLLEPRTATFQQFVNDQSPDSLSHNYVMSISQDRGGLLWVGTRSSGANIWNPRSWSLGHYTGDWLQGNNVTAFASHAQQLWVGTFDHGLTKLENGVEKRTFRADELGVDRVMSLLLDRRQQLWIGTMGGGLNRLNTATDEIVNYRYSEQAPLSLSSDGIMSLLEDRQGNIWVGTFGGGVDGFDAQMGTFTPLAPGKLTSLRAMSMAQDMDGYIWVGTDAGLNRVQPQTGEVLQFTSDPENANTLSSNTIYALHVDRLGTLWIGTAGGGLNRLDIKDGEITGFTSFAELEELLSNVVYGVRSDIHGQLWLSTNNGLARFDPSSGEVKRFHKAHGLQGEEFNFGAHHSGEFGVLYFGGANGFNAVSPARLQENETKPDVVLTSVQTMNQAADTPVPYPSLQQFDVAYDSNALTFEFAALDFTAPSENRYSYMLDGFDNDWAPPSSVRRATYTNLDAGKYIFRVRAANSDGVWNNDGVAVAFTVAPAPWRTDWAYAGYATFLLLLCAFILRQKRAKKGRELEHRRQLYSLAYFDALTGLPNRQKFKLSLQAAIRESKANGCKLALIYLDLDEFKRINDTLGHRAGDAVLKLITKRLQSVVAMAMRIYPSLNLKLARLGGDEFVVIITGLKDGKAAGNLAQRIMDLVAKPLKYNRYELVITTSMGISVYPNDGSSVQSLMKNADTALFQAKEAGRKEYKFYSRAMNARALEDLALESELRSALENDELYMVYHPKVDINSAVTTGAEALIRWDHPERGAIAPDIFIPLAERSGLILDIDRWVVEKVIGQIGEWLRAGVNLVPIALNLSGREFVDKNLAWALSQTAEKADVATEFVEIEITESVLATDAEAARATVSKLRSMGFGVAIDDFGTGYSSLSYLKNFAVSALKIDRSFVTDLCEHAEDQAICAAIIAMAKGLGIKSVAEGVATDAQLSLLRDLGCDYAQGYLFHKPLRVADFQALLEKQGSLQRLVPVEPPSKLSEIKLDNAKIQAQ